MIQYGRDYPDEDTPPDAVEPVTTARRSRITWANDIRMRPVVWAWMDALVLQP